MPLWPGLFVAVQQPFFGLEREEQVLHVIVWWILIGLSFLFTTVINPAIILISRRLARFWWPRFRADRSTHVESGRQRRLLPCGNWHRLESSLQAREGRKQNEDLVGCQLPRPLMLIIKHLSFSRANRIIERSFKVAIPKDGLRITWRNLCQISDQNSGSWFPFNTRRFEKGFFGIRRR